MDVLNWIPRHEVPQHKKVTYPHYTVDIRPEKSEPNQTRITAEGDQLDYHGNVSTHSVNGDNQNPLEQRSLNAKRKILHWRHFQHVPVFQPRQC